MRPAILLPVLAAMLAGCGHRAPATATPRQATSRPAPAAEAARKAATSDAAPSDSRGPAPAAEPSAAILWRVVSVHDGDTLTVLDDRKVQHKVRLAGIDAPELRQAFGTKARERLAAMTMGKAVAVLGDERDRFGRTVARIEVEGQDINKAMVAAGMAWHFKRYSTDATLAEIEAEARAARRGLWGDPEAVPPWEWRAGEKARKAATRQPAGR